MTGAIFCAASLANEAPFSYGWHICRMVAEAQTMKAAQATDHRCLHYTYFCGTADLHFDAASHEHGASIPLHC